MFSHTESIWKCIHPLSLIALFVAVFLTILCQHLWLFLCCKRRKSSRVDCSTEKVFDHESQIVKNNYENEDQRNGNMNDELENLKNNPLSERYPFSLFLDFNDFQFHEKNDDYSVEVASKLDSLTNSGQFDDQDIKTDVETINSNNNPKLKVTRLIVPIKDSLINISKSIQDKISLKKMEKNKVSKKGKALSEWRNEKPTSSLATTPNSGCSYKDFYQTFAPPIVTVSHEDKEPENIKSNILRCICFKQSLNSSKIIEKHVHSAKYKREAIRVEYGFRTAPTTPGKVFCRTVEAHLSSLQKLYHPNIAQLTGILSLNNLIENTKVQPMSDYVASTNELLVYKQQCPEQCTIDMAPITSQSKCRRPTNDFGCFKSGLLTDKQTFNNVTLGMSPLKMDDDSRKATERLHHHERCVNEPTDASCASQGMRCFFTQKVFLHYFAWHNCHGPSLAEVIHGDKLDLIEARLRFASGAVFSANVFTSDNKSENNSQISISSRKSLVMESLCIDRSMKLALLNDIVQAMLYLQSTGLLEYHGVLNLRNCYLDSRFWRAKVAGFGWHPILEAVSDDPTIVFHTNYDDNHTNEHSNNQHEQFVERKYSGEASPQDNNMKSIFSPASLSKIDLLYIAPEHLPDIYSFFQASSFPNILPSSTPSTLLPSRSPSRSIKTAASKAAAMPPETRTKQFGSSAGDVYSFALCAYQFIFELLPYETYFEHYTFEQILQNIYDPKFNRQFDNESVDDEQNEHDVDGKDDGDDEDDGAENDDEGATGLGTEDDRCCTNKLKCENNSANSTKIENKVVNKPRTRHGKKNNNSEYFRPKLISRNQFYEKSSDDSPGSGAGNNLNINQPAQPSTSIPTDVEPCIEKYNILIELMQNCWKPCPEDRPTFEEISRTITVMQIYNDPSKIFAKLNDKRRTRTKEQCLLEYSNKNTESNRINLVLNMFRSQNRKLEAQNILSNTEKFNSQKLLNRVLPSAVSRSLLMGEFVKPEKFDSVTIAFSDIVGFTTLASYSTPLQVVEVLNNLFTAFDLLLKSFDVYKLETIGDAYMVASGVPIRNDNHECQIALLTLEMLKVCSNFKIEHMPGVPLKIRIGIHTGPVVGGVVGTENPRYCLFGDTVNIASRLESTGQPNMIHVSKATQKALKASNTFVLKYRDSIELRGRGRYPTYWLLGTKDANQVNDDVVRSLVEQESSSFEEANGHGITDESIFTSIGLTQHEI